MKNVSLLLFLFSLIGHAATNETPLLPSTPYKYSSPELPSHFRTTAIQLADTEPGLNRVTDEGATLGRVLFYDKKLSANNSISCASCHQQSQGFSDSAQFSRGLNGVPTLRHSMGLSNVRYNPSNRFFWDQRVTTLENQVLHPLQNPDEMAISLESLPSKLSAYNYYPALFKKAFGDTEINTQRISQALAQFLRSMISYQSKYDVGVATNFSNFNAQEEAGRQLFNSSRTNCRRCHGTDLQIMNQALNNGLEKSDTKRFKAPSLRNIAVRPPYMHDGRFDSMQQVVSFYNSKIQDNPKLDNRLRRHGKPLRMGLNNEEQNSIVAFLKTLTDNEFLNNPAFSNPFEPNLNEISNSK